MLDINYIEQNLTSVNKRLKTRGTSYEKELKFVVKKNQERKTILGQAEKLKAEKNQISREIGILIQRKELKEIKSMKTKSQKLDQKIEQLDQKLQMVSKTMNDALAYIPNLPHEKMPVGKDETKNVVVAKSQTKKLLKTQIPHWEIATKLKLVNFEWGPKISGSRFLVYTGLGSKMIRVLGDILLSSHVQNGYQELFVPVIVNQEAMFGTGQLPKFAEDAYQVGNQYLIPTAEVPLTNLHANEILDVKVLPVKYTAFTQCFRQEAGAAGRDTKGMIRLHQFNKVELVKIVEASESMNELELLAQDAQRILNLFELPYQMVELCTGDVGFSATKTYDLEVWFPNQQKYREISSCSNCGDFQARNIKTRYRDENGKVQLVHTLNGSGVAIDRLMAAILENYWDGEKLILPLVMRPYFNNQEFIK